MPTVPACHSVKEDVYHNNSACTERNNIERENLRSGIDGKRLCERCAELNRQGR